MQYFCDWLLLLLLWGVTYRSIGRFELTGVDQGVLEGGVYFWDLLRAVVEQSKKEILDPVANTPNRVPIHDGRVSRFRERSFAFLIDVLFRLKRFWW